MNRYELYIVLLAMTIVLLVAVSCSGGSDNSNGNVDNPKTFSISPGSTSLQNGETAVIGAVIPPGMSSVSYEWYVDDVLQIGETGVNLSFSRIIFSEAAYAVKYTATDGTTSGGSTAIITVTPEVVPEDPAYVLFNSPANHSSQAENTVVSLEGQAASPDTVAAVNTSGLDIIILMQESGAISGTDFSNMQAFATDLVATGISLDPLHIGVGVVAFATSARTIIPLSFDGAAVNTAIAGIIKTGGIVNFDSGLIEAEIVGNAGTRPEVPKLILLISNGDGGTASAATIAANIRANTNPSWSILAIGFTVSYNLAYLETLTGNASYVVHSSVYTSDFMDSLITPFASLNLTQIDLEVLDSNGTSLNQNVPFDSWGRISFDYTIPAAGRNSLITLHVYGADASHRAARLLLQGVP